MKKTVPIMMFLSAGLALLGADIRKFDQATTEKLGVAIFEQDIRAAKATDLLFAKKIDPAKVGLRGWIVEGDAKSMLVRFVTEKDGNVEAFYDVSFVGRKTPTIAQPQNTQLTVSQRAQFKARTLAAKSITRPASRNYNLVILPDPEREGLLVYALAATTEPNSIMVGGHYRFTVSQDGERIEQSDELFRSFMVLSKKPKDLPPGAIPQALWMTTLVSNLPLETHVYLSLQHETTFVVGTPDSHVWEVGKGKMRMIK